jgi:DinB superfamily
MEQGRGNREQGVASKGKGVEPWLRGTFGDVDAVVRAVLHSLEMAEEDGSLWCGGLSDEEINARPAGIAPVAFHLRHIARSLDRLLSYAEGMQLDETQKTALKTELDAGATRDAVMAEFVAGLRSAAVRVREFSAQMYNVGRGVGRAQLPTTVGGLLVHCAEHTQRHVGQAVTTAKVVVGMR